MPYLQHILVTMAIYAIFIMSLNLVVGYTGLLSVAHAGLGGVGAYAVAILLLKHGWTFPSAVLAAVLFAGGVALLAGFVLGRLRGDYFALGSLGLNAILTAVMLNVAWLTNGPLGIARIPFPEIAGMTVRSLPAFLLLTSGAFALVLGGCFWITRSSFGLVLKATREDEDAIQIFGYETRKYKLLIFSLSGALAGFSGALYATYIRFVDPTPFTILFSVEMLVAATLGGLGRLRGSLIGAFLFIGLSELVRFFGFTSTYAAQYRLAVVGLLLIVLMILRPQGILGSYKLK